MTPRTLGSAPITGSVMPPPPKVRLMNPVGRGIGPLRDRLVVRTVLSSLAASRESAMRSSPGQAASITRVSNTPLFMSRTVADVVVADKGAPAVLVRFIQTPPRVSRPCCIAPPIRLKGSGLISLTVVPAPGREKTRNSPGFSRISALM